MSDLTENDVFMSAFEPLATNGNRRNTKRRSSILKTDVNYGNEERRASRRVSWAQTYQYKELLADGTTVVMLQELNSHQKTEESVTSDPLPQIDNNNDENKDQNSTESEEKVNASAFISRLKANTSMNKSFAENPNKRQNCEEVINTSAAKKPKKGKRNSSKGLTKYLAKHYEIETNQKDYETVFNTSFNKYGRELVSRTERPDFTQLFVDDNDMNLTKMTEKSEEHNQTNRMSLTLNETIPESSQEMTRYFNDQSLAITETTESLVIEEKSFDSPEDEQNLGTKYDSKRDTDFNRSFSVYSVESFRRTERQDLTQLFSNNSMNLIDSTEPLVKLKDHNLKDMSVEDIAINTSHEEVEELIKEVINETLNKITENHNQTDRMSLTLFETISESSAQEVVNETHYFIDESMTNTEKNETTESMAITENSIPTPDVPSISSRIPKPMPRKSLLPSIQLSAINKIPKAMVCEQKKLTSIVNMGWLAQTTLHTTLHTNNNTLNLHNMTQNMMNRSVKPMAEPTQTLRIGSQMSNSIFRRKQKPFENNEILTETNQIVSTSINVSHIESTDSPVAEYSRPLTSTSIRRPNRKSLSTRIEMSKSALKDMFGLGMTERLKQKRDEMDAKNRQSIVTNAFTPSASNSVSDLRQTLILSSTKNVSELSTDLFNSKTDIETEDMEVENNSETDLKIPEPEPTPEVECKTNEEKTEMDSENDCESETNESKSNSVSKSEKSNSIQSKSSLESKELTDNVSDSRIPSSLAISTISSSSASETSSLEFNTTSPLSVSVVHSSDNYLVSSPTTIDPTLNFTFNRSDSSNSFDPFIHTNQSFHTNHSFYETSSPMQLSFMMRDDTLCILADELERQIEDIVIPIEEQKLSISTAEELSDMFLLLRKLDAKLNGFTYEVLGEEKALISYLWGTFALEVRFGSVVEDPNTPFIVRHILSINMKSLISSEEPLHMRQKDLILKFNDSHKPLITIAHDLIISSFESERQQIISRHKTSASLHQLVSDISVKVLSAKKLLTELRAISSSEVCRLYPKVDDRYRLVVEILGIRKPIYLVLPINPKSYPDEVIRPEIRIRKEDKHLYCLQQFCAAFLRIEPRKFDYIQRLIRGTKAFVRAKKRIIYDKQKNLKQKNAIKSAKLPDSVTKSSL